MAKSDDKIELEGVIMKAYPQGVFLVRLDTEGFEGHELRAKLSGKMRMHYIRLVEGDRVRLTVSPYNVDEGLITFRYSNRPRRDPNASGPRGGRR